MRRVNLPYIKIYDGFAVIVPACLVGFFQRIYAINVNSSIRREGIQSRRMSLAVGSCVEERGEGEGGDESALKIPMDLPHH